MKTTSFESLNSFPVEVQVEVRKVLSEIKKEILKKLKLTTICNYFISNKECLRHIEKRLKMEHISTIEDYVTKIKTSIKNPEEIIWGVYNKDFKEKFNLIDRLYFRQGDWVTIILVDIDKGDWKIVTSFELNKEFCKIILKNREIEFEKLIRIK